ncbi:MAG: hypothetical protein N2255_05290, partial [Kiritimatiellae bacterium]|nr:hypothetical protein [Kiritimatiellia bacterium]
VLYDRRSAKIARVIQPLHPRAFYVYRALETPDGRALVMSSLPNAIITLVDQDSYEIEQFEPDALKGVTNHHAGQFVQDDVFFTLSGRRSFLLSYPGFRKIAEIPSPEDVTGFSRSSFVLNGQVGVWGMGTNMLYLLNFKKQRWEPMLDHPVVPVRPDDELYCGALAALEDGSVCGFTADCVFFRVPPGVRRAETRQAEIPGPVMAWGPMVIVNEPGFHMAYGSTHGIQRFWGIDLDTGVGRDLGDSGPGGGQVNDMLWDPEQRLLFLASYGTCTLLAYDPAGNGVFPENPRVVAKIGHNQMRPLQLLREESSAWMISTSHYSLLGGALSRICLFTGHVEVYRDFLRSLAPTRMLFNPCNSRELFLSTTIHADCQSAIPAENEARLFRFDLDRRRVIGQHVPRKGAGTLKLMAASKDGGKILYLDVDARELWTWDWQANTTSRIGLAPLGLREIVRGPGDADFWATAYAGIGPLIFAEECRIEPALPVEITRNAFDGLGKYLTWDGQTLWFSTGLELIGAEWRHF